MTNCIRENTMIIIFVMLLGSLIHIIDLAGGAKAYRNFASKKIKSGKMAMILTAIFSVAIVIDDYFNALTSGMVMRPVIDKYRISRVKFACIIDLIASPICVLVPVSSWAASIISCLNNSEIAGSEMFFKMIPYNFYAILAIVFAFFMASNGFNDFGEMANVIKREKIENKFKDSNQDHVEKSSNGKIYDLIVPILVLMVVSVWLIIKINDTVFGITVSSFVALISSFFMFVPRKLISFKQFIDGVTDGMTVMLSAIVTLVLAWTLSDLTKEHLGTGDFIAQVMSKISISETLIPALIFIFSVLLAYSIGSSWGTFAILIPVTCAICSNSSQEILLYSLAAVTSGAIAGINCSPISNTMIMVSSVAVCDHLTHAFSELPYAVCVAVSSLFGYILLGFTRNFFASFIPSLVFMVAITKFLGKKATS